MEHEDNAQLSTFLQNSQNLMENLQIAASVGGHDDGGFVSNDEIVADIDGTGANIGGKFEEQKEHDYDDDELKYKEEVQQSEKQQQQNLKFDDSEDGGGVYNVKGDSIGEMVVQHDEYVFDDSTIQEIASGTAIIVDEEEVEIIKNDGDFSTTSNTTSTAGEDEEVNMLQQDSAHQIIYEKQHEQQQKENITHLDEKEAYNKEGEIEADELSSLANNTTHDTICSLSENLQQQQQTAIIENASDMIMGNKENVNPLITADNDPQNVDINLELHSQLNPDAMEFVPSFASNTVSPTSIEPTSKFINNIQVDESDTTSLQTEESHLNPIPRHLLNGDDDFVAQSPRKGRHADMESIAIPEENDFENEAAKRPHGLEQECDIIGDRNLEQPLQFDELLNTNNSCNDKNSYKINSDIEDCLDFQYPETSSSNIDHGPETSVDLDADINIMQKSIYVENNCKPFEDVLNTVQPLPHDFENVNTSFDEEGLQNGSAVCNKELFNFEEKEHISHTPSTEEEIQTNKQFEFQTDVLLQNPINMTNPVHIQETFNLGQSSQQQVLDNNIPILDHPSPSNDNVKLFEDHNIVTSAFTEPIILDTEFAQFDTPAVTDVIHPSIAVATEEKHLIEETKEQTSPITTSKNSIDEIEQKLENLVHPSNIGNLSEVDEVAFTVTTNTEEGNPFFTQKFNTQQLEDEILQNEPKGLIFQCFTGMEQVQNNFLTEEQHEKYDQQHEILNDIDINSDFVIVPESIKDNDGHLAANEIVNVESILKESIPSLSVDIATEILKSDIEETSNLNIQNSITAQNPTPSTEQINNDVENEVPIIEISAVEAVVAATTAITATLPKKTTITKKTTMTTAKTTPTTTTTASKAKSSDSKKPVEIKKSVGNISKSSILNANARSRTAPTKVGVTSSSIEKKSPGSARTGGVTGPKKTMSPTTTTTKLTSAKSTTNNSINNKSSTVSLTKPGAITTAVRKPTSTTSGGSTVSKTRISTSGATAPTKPTTLSISSTAAKTKLTSPRSNLGLQMRKSTTSTTSAIKSPIKITVSSNGIAARSSIALPLANRSKGGVSTVNTTATTTITTKTFTARPAPKTTSSTTTNTATRRLAGGLQSISSTTTKANNAAIRKTSPNKPTSGSGTGAAKSSPLNTKSTKDVMKVAKIPPIGIKKSSKSTLSKTNQTAVPSPPINPIKVNSAEEIIFNGGGDHQATKQGNGSRDMGQNGIGEHNLLNEPQQVIADELA